MLQLQTAIFEKVFLYLHMYVFMYCFNLDASSMRILCILCGYKTHETLCNFRETGSKRPFSVNEYNKQHMENMLIEMPQTAKLTVAT